MKPQWYCGADGQQFGPFTWEQMRAMAAEGRLQGESYVRREADQQWFLAAQIPGLIAKAKPAPTVAPAPVEAAPATAPVAVAAAPAPMPAAPASAGTAAVGTAPPSNGAAGVKLKKAKPLTAAPVVIAAPPAGVAVGQAVPTGMPVGQPVPAGVPVGAPVGQPVAQMSFAVGPRAPSHDDGPSPKKKSSNSWVLVGVLGGVCGVVAIAAVVLISMSMAKPPKADDEEAVASAEAEIAAAQKIEQAAGQAEEKPVTEANPTAVAPASGSKGGSAAPGGASSDSAAATVITSQTKWINLLTHRAIKLGTTSLQVSSVWLASDAQGTRVNPTVSAAAGTPPAEPTPAAEGEPAPAAVPETPAPAVAAEAAPAAPVKFVFVEVKVTNGGPVPKKYASWNAAEATAAVLVDQTNQVLAPVPVSATPGVPRLGIVQLAPGQVVTDLLVFTAPARPVESLKLVLAKTAIADTAKDRWAFDVPLESLFPKAAPAGSAPAVGSGPVVANQTPIPGVSDLPPAIIDPNLPAKPVEPQPAPAVPAPVEPPKKPNRPPTAEELNKQFEELDKAKKDAEKAAAEKAAAEKGAK